MRNSAPSSPRFFPPVGAPQNEILDYRDRVINPWSSYRNQQMARVSMWMWYFLGRQWATLDYQAAFDGARGAILRSALDDGDIPRPVTNEIDPAVESTVIALVKREWTASVTPSSNDPAIKAAAQVAKDQLQFRLDELLWPEKRHQHALHYTVTGTGLLYTAWDRTYMDLCAIGSPSAMWCPSCETKLYSDLVPEAVMKAGIGGRPISFVDSAKPLDPTHPDFDLDAQYAKLSSCPNCAESRPLQPYEPDENEAAEGEDAFGRPLGVLQPRGGSTLEVDLPFEIYPEDGGFRQTPATIRRFGRRKIRSMEWWEERCPHLVEEIEPDSVSELLYTDPILNEWSTAGRWDVSLDAGILDNHANADELIEQPTLRNPKGRYALCSKNKVLIDEDLLECATLDGEEVYVPKAQISAARFKIRPNEFFGSGLPVHMISPSNRLNSMDSQIVEWRERLGNPNVYLPSDMWVDNPVHEYGGDGDGRGGGRAFFFQASMSNPEFTKPEVFGGLMMPDGVYQERDRVQADIKRQNGPQDASIGAAPKNVGTTSGLQFLVDQDERSQILREDELIRSGEKAFSHILRMQWILRIDPEVYRVLGPDKAWSYDQYTGEALRGQCEVKVERGPAISKGIVDREAAREAIADGLVDINSPLMKREMLNVYGLDPDLAPETTHQIDHAERMWVDFREHGLVRIQDGTLDEPQLHFLVLGKHLRTEEGERLADESGWDEILQHIAGWQDQLMRLETLDQMTIAFYGGRIIGEEAQNEEYGKALVAYNGQMEIFQQQQQIHEQLTAQPSVMGAPPPVAPVEPQMPPPAKFLPALMQEKVMLVWGSMLAASNFPLPQPDAASQIEGERPTDAYIKFRALIEAYRLSAMGGMASAGAVPAPGSPAPAPPQTDPNAAAAGAPAGGQSAPAPDVATTAPMPEGGSN